MKKLILAVAALVAMGGSALAADLAPVAPPAPPVPVAPSFNWGGLYAGVYGGIIPGTPPSLGEAGVTVGANFITAGPLLFGVDTKLGISFGPGLGVIFEAEANARLGFVLGDAGNVLVFGEGGLGYFSGGAGPFWDVGGGLEFALGQRASIFADAKYLQALSLVGSAVEIQLGVNWHFGH